MLKSDIKDKIPKLINYTIFFVLIFFTLASFVITYITYHQQYKSDIEMIKNNYIENQKNMIKHQVNNVIRLIETLREAKTQEVKKEIKNHNLAISDVLIKCPVSEYKFVLKKLDKENPFLFFTLSDLKGNLIYTPLSDYNKSKRIKIINKLLNEKKDGIYFIHRTPKGLKVTYQHIFSNYLFTTSTYQHIIDKFVKERIIQIVNNIRFGPENNGYISIAEILDYKGGKKFAKVIALPVKPDMVGKILSDDKKDAKGKLYRKEYLKIANTTGEGFVSYWFYKYSDKMSPKISYIKIYKPWNWLIFTSIFLDDINTVLAQKEKQFNREISKIAKEYLILLIIVIAVAFFIVKSLNKTVKNLIEKYDKFKRIEARLNTMFTDRLTGLPNREKLLLDLKDNNYVAIINIDDFKEINDFFGIEEGDKLIKEVGKFLEVLYPTYKLSGDEYALIHENPGRLKRIVSHIIKELNEKSFKIKDENIKINITAGIGKNLPEADIALKYAKNKKNKQIIVYNEKLPVLKEYENNLKWRQILHEAIKNDNIIPYVQPIVNNKTRKIEKYECLMRIRHGDEIYTPYHFLEIAKKTHLYEKIQTALIKKCFKKFSDTDYNFSINLSLKDLRNQRFMLRLRDYIKEYNVADQLTIELLEDEEMIQDKKIQRKLKRLHDMGVKIAIDDFGSGYSNFIYLIKNLPVSILKIDGSLVKDILKDEKIKMLLQKIIEIANELELETIAEYVENEELFQELIKLNATASQGYYFSKPFDIEELE